MKQTVLTFLLALLPLVASADDSGSCGVNVTWSYNAETKTLVISGSGDMTNEYYGGTDLPWYPYQKQILHAVISSGVTSIGNYSFYECLNMLSVDIASTVTSIGEFTFYGCSSLANITIPNSVTNIGKGTFDGTPWYDNQPDGLVYAGKVAYCYKGEMPSNTNIVLEEDTKGIAYSAFAGFNNLASITIPNNVTTIGEYAFDRCSGLASIIIGNSVTSIGIGAFNDCSSLANITIPNSVTYIGKNAFEGCYYTEVICYAINVPETDGIIFNGSANSIKLIVPRSSGEKYSEDNNWNAYGGITSVLDYAEIDGFSYELVLEDNGEITAQLVGATDDVEGEVSIPTSVSYNSTLYSVTTIGDGAFSGCSDLTSVSIPNSITSIGISAFYECSGLTSVTIPNSVKTIGDGAFSGSGLTSVTIPSSVTIIGDAAFSYCSGLNSISVDGSNTIYDSRDGCNAIIKTSTKTLISGCKSTIIPSSVTSIGDNAFEGCSSLTSITIPNSVTNIGSNAFGYCSGLTSVTIPNSVTSIEDCAFESCTGLTSVSIANSVKTIGNDVFYGCKDLTNLNIPNSVTSMGNWSFEDFGQLISVSLPECISSIDARAFYGCSSLISIAIPSSVSNISSRAFGGCNNLRNLYLSDIAAWCAIDFSNATSNPFNQDGEHHVYLNNSEIKELEIPNGVTSISEYAFHGFNSLTSVVISESVTNIGNHAFQGCSSLTSVHISNIAAWCQITFGSVDANPLFYAQHLYLGDQEIKDLVIPSTITTINSNTFRNCSGFTSLTIPNSVTNISEYAFEGCSGLVTATLSDNVSMIRQNTFSECSSLEAITIPASVEYIYQYAFSGCTSLETVNVQASTPPFLYDNSFSNYTVPLNVPSGTAEIYRTAQGWSNFTTINDGNVYYQLSVANGQHGVVTYGEATVAQGTNETFNVQEGGDVSLTITPNDDYQLKTVTVDGVDKTEDVVAANGVLTITDMAANVNVAISYELATQVTSVTIGAAGMATYCPMEDVDFTGVEGLKAYIGSGFNRTTGQLLMTRVYDVPAGTGLILVGEPDSYEISYSPSVSSYASLLVGCMEPTEISQTSGSKTNYTLQAGSHGVGFYIVEGSGTLAAGKCYLQLSTQPSQSRRMVTVKFDDEATIINEVESQEAASVEWFSLDGQKLQGKPAKKGVYLRSTEGQDKSVKVIVN